MRGGKGAVRKLKRAQILLAADVRSTDEAIARNVGVGTSTVYRTKQRFVEDGLDLALKEASRPGSPRKLSASDEALLVAVACSRPPSGQARWTLELLANEMVRLTVHETLSGDTVGRRLAEMELKPWREKMWCIPEVNAEYVARMEDVLDLYAEEPEAELVRIEVDSRVRAALAERTAVAELLSTAEAGRYARVAPRSIRRWLVQGKLQALHAGRELRIRRADLDKLMCRGRRRTDAGLTPEQLAERDFG